MAPVVRFLPPFVLLSAAIAAAGAEAGGRWDGDYSGQGEFDIDRRCIAREFQATGLVRDNVLFVYVKKKGKTVKELQFVISEQGRIPRSLLCSSGNTTAFVKGVVRGTEIRLETEDIRSGSGRSLSRMGGAITLSRVSVPRPAPPQHLGAAARPPQAAAVPPPPAPRATRPAAPAPRDPAAGGRGGAVRSLDRAALIELQRDLKALGYYYGKVDGVFGGGTRGAIASYQRSQGLPVTGNLSAAQLARLRAEADRAAGRSRLNGERPSKSDAANVGPERVPASPGKGGDNAA